MALSRKQIEVLTSKLMDGTITPSEQERLNHWLNEQMVKNTYEVNTSFATDAEQLRQRMLRRILEAVNQGRHHRRKPRRLTWWAYATAAIVLCAIGISIYLTIDSAPSVYQLTELPDIAPGGNRATLTLADGSTIDLSENQAGIVVGEDLSYADGSGILDGKKETLQIAATSKMVVSTPRGGTYQVTLPDGTHVWLNASSSLTYPVRFNSNERVVELSGEGYFSVARDQNRPFKLLSDGHELTVLGTEFNISAYPDEDEVKTTLVNGEVQVALSDSHRDPTVLVPGQQAIVRESAIDVLQVDVRQYTAWKEGLFFFKGVSPPDALRQLSRWYDIEIVCEGKLPTAQFYGMIERSRGLSAVLDILRESGMDFRMQKREGGNRLIVINE